MKLYDLAEQYNDLIDLLEQDGTNEELQHMLDGLQGKLEEKIDAVLSIRNGRKAEAVALKEEAKRLEERAAQFENEAKRLDQLVANTLNMTGKEKLKTLKFTVWMQMNRPSVEVVNPDLVPKDYFIQKEPEIRKSLILEAWNEGKIIPGVAIRQEKSLRVR